ncbi:MAG: cyclic pyranopterin monophosphate synthase MoaC [Thermoplasmata archaeon]|nr:cyclic pyranopterin monophosphate synthase MoaC [Thermoplasmata archaeon]
MCGMVNVSGKENVLRVAEASGKIFLKRETIEAIRQNKVKKGNPLTVAEISGILAVKRTWEHIPHCHQIPVTAVDFGFEIGETFISVTCRVEAIYKTGVEMEALTGVTNALLTIWDMVKYLEKDRDGSYPDTRITDIVVVSKLKEERDGVKGA